MIHLKTDEEIHRKFEEDDAILQAQSNGQESLINNFQCYKTGYNRGKSESGFKIKKVYAILEEMEKRADFFYKDATDLANKNYERGFFDGIHNARSKIKETLETNEEAD